MTLLSKQIGRKALNLIALAGFVGLLLLSFPVVSKASSHNSCSTSTKSIYSDFGNLDVESLKQTDENGDILNSRFPIPKTEEVLINNVVSNSTESVGDLTISFADDPGSGLDPNDQPGFFALTDCFNRSNPSECNATSTLIQADDGIVPRKLTAQGGGSSPSDNTDTSDITMDAELGDRVELKTEASTNIGENANAHVQAGIDITDITLEVCESTNDPPTAVDDGNNDASICNSGSTQNISVLDNDFDPDDDDLTVESVENPTDLGGIAAIGCDGDCVQYTPPFDTTGTDEFDYTAKDTNDNTATATVSVNLNAEDCGDISVSFQDDNGNSVSVDNAFVNYNDDELTGSGNSFSYEVDLFDDGRDALINQGFITPPEGYKVKESEWVNKVEAEETYDQPNKSELGF